MKQNFKQWAWRTLLTLTCLLITAPAWADTWTVAGSENVFGSNWSPGDANNDMTTSDNVNYTWSKSSVALTTSGFEFKVVKNHEWGEQYPNSNYVVKISENANYDIVITFNSDTKAVNASVTKAADTWTVAGSEALFGSDWSTTDTSNDMTTTDGVTYTWTKENVTLNQGTIEFKVVKNHSWDTAYPASNYQLSIPSNGAYNVTITFDSGTKEINATITPLFVTPPVFSLASGTYDTNKEVTITTAGTGTIYYTTDGTNPTTSSTVYSGAISVAGEGEHIIKAVVINGEDVSEVVTREYVIKYQNIYVFGSVGKAHTWVYDYTNPELITSDGINYSGVINVLNMPGYPDRTNAGLFMLTTGFGSNWETTQQYMIGTTSKNNFWIDGTTSYLDTWVDAAPVGQSDKGWTIIPANGNGTPYEFFYNKETNQFKLATFDGPTIYVYDYTRPYIYVEDADHVPYDGVQPGNPIQILDETVGGHSGLSSTANGSGLGTGTLGWYKFAVPVHPSNCPSINFQFHHNGDKKVIDSDMYTMTLSQATEAYYYWDGAAYQPIAKADVNNLRRIVAHVRVQGTTVPTCDGVAMNGPSSFYGQMYYWMAVTKNNEGVRMQITDGTHTYDQTITSDIYLEWTDANSSSYNLIDETTLQSRLASKTGVGTIIHLQKNRNTDETHDTNVLGVNTWVWSASEKTNVNTTNLGRTWWGRHQSNWAGETSGVNYKNSRFIYQENGLKGNPDVYIETSEDGAEWYTWYEDNSVASVTFGYGTLASGATYPYYDPDRDKYQFFMNYESPAITQQAGELWYVWTPDFSKTGNDNGELIDVTRTYESRAKQKALCSTVREGNYVYYTDIKGWGDNNIFCYVFEGTSSLVGPWPGIQMTKIGYDDEGHPVYLIDLSNYDLSGVSGAAGIIFNNGKEDTDNTKAQTGNLEWANGGCYDYLGLIYRIGGNTDVIENEPDDNPATVTLRGVWYSRVKGTLFAKGNNDYNNKSVNGYGYIDFAKEEGLQSSDYDQSNWVEIEPSESVTASDLIGLLDMDFTLYGTKLSSVNPRFKAISISNVENGAYYTPNHFTPAHFNGTPYLKRSGDDEWYFFVEPKPNEFGQIFWTIYSRTDDAFYALANTGFTGTINVDWSYHDPDYTDQNMTVDLDENAIVGVDSKPDLEDLNGYSGWLAIIKFTEETPAGGTTAKSATGTQYEAGDVAPSATAGKYTVYPICLNDDYVTAIDNINVDKRGDMRSLKSTRYYNMMGVESATPFEGVNIIVKEYTDGSRESSKAIMR